MAEFLIHNAKIVKPGVSIATGYLHVREGRIVQLGEGSNGLNMDCPFITHTRASVEQTLAAINAGASHATHFYDVFPFPEETDPGVRPVGVVETILGDRRGTCDYICDGIHVHPMAVRAAVAAKGWQGVALITDASFGAGLMPGIFDTPWGYSVEVKEGNAPRIADPDHPMCGALAGSALTMNRGMENLFRWLDLPEEQTWAMGTRTPACILGAASKGDLAVGMDADLVLWRGGIDGLEPGQTWVAGEMVYDARVSALIPRLCQEKQEK